MFMADPPTPIPDDDDTTFRENLLDGTFPLDISADDIAAFTGVDPSPLQITEYATDDAAPIDLFDEQWALQPSAIDQVGSLETPSEANTQQNNSTVPSVLSAERRVPYSCSFCQVLREITHTKGNLTTKLEIHGRLGIFSHALLDTQLSAEGSYPNHLYQMFDFSEQTIAGVKRVLYDYCKDRKQAGFLMLEDPLLLFYETLCIGRKRVENANPSTSSGACDKPEKVHHGATSSRSVLAIQRERAAKLTLRDISKYFHLPIETAAQKLSLCPTVIKKICRKYKLKRWPYRKIKGKEKKISRLRKGLSGKSKEESLIDEAKIEKLQEEITNIYRGIDSP